MIRVKLEKRIILALRFSVSVLSFPFCLLPSFLPLFLPFIDILCHTWYQMSNMEDIIPILVMGESSNSHSVFFVLWMLEGPRSNIWETGKEQSQRKLFCLNIPSHTSFLYIVAYLPSYKTIFRGHISYIFLEIYNLYVRF